MSNTVSGWFFEKDEKNVSSLLEGYDVDDGSKNVGEWSILSSLEEGYCPSIEILKEVLKDISKSSPESYFRFYIHHDYAEEMWDIQDGKLKKLKKEWI